MIEFGASLEDRTSQRRGVAQPEPRHQAYRKLHAEMAHWERHLQHGGDYLVGDRMTLADVAVFPSIAFAVRTGLTLAKRCPKAGAWYERMAARPSVEASWPPHWRQSEGPDGG
ncbi:MAG: glutathione S-transferase C-terminal domain-containing protein [Myxococcales bacterium]|nr:glutathione S-transferase C-terminal domain-containing protein [Myxococcales bacterium]